MRIVKAAALYFALVFAAGFVLGIVRTLLVVPRLGVRTAELIEMPVMLFVTILAARSIVRRLAVPSKLLNRLGMGIVGVTILLAVEFSVVLWLRQVTISESFATRDPVSGTVYYIMLVVFTLMPVFVVRSVRSQYQPNNLFNSIPVA